MDAETDTQMPDEDRTVATDHADGQRKLPRALTPFRGSAYRRLAIALVFSTFATGVWGIALVWEVIRMGGDASQFSVVATASALGVIIPALLGGVVADRIPQKRILLVVAGLELLTMSLVATLSLLDITQLWMLATVAFVNGMALAFYYPAYTAWLPALVEERDLMAVNGFEGMVRPTIGQAIGPAVAGAAIAAANPGTAIVIAATSVLLGLLALMAVPETPLRRQLDETHSVHPIKAAAIDVREGFTYMVRTPWLLATLIFASLMILVMMGPFEVLVPFLIKDRLGGGPRDHAWVLAAFGIGGAVGSLIMASLPMPRRYLTWMNLLWGVGSLPLAVIGYAGHIWIVIAAAFVLGTTFSAPMVIWGTLLQRRVPPALVGRVASLDFFVSISLMPVSMAMAGPVSDVIGIRPTFLIAGVVPGVIAIIAILWARLPADEIAHPLRDDEPDVIAPAV
ncbi:MFS transporter [Knoellia subterranea]|uniref:MFS transporter n=1 Tax=Knoellia subterranea KCTC 19937 TaxID=1385521 RepID=A0A0A0JMD0_9MICO|nr:MFS transporter [Knoellia subterranea]KGN37899.1 MFS transporter [Knoellia subterranea KCTC 19937]